MAERKHRGETPLLEWIVGGLGAVIFCAMLAILGQNALSNANAPPDIRVRIERITSVENGYAIAFIARNEGDITAAGAEFTATLNSGAMTEQHQATIDYLPPHSERRGGFLFANDPRAGALTIRAGGYSDP